MNFYSTALLNNLYRIFFETAKLHLEKINKQKYIPKFFKKKKNSLKFIIYYLINLIKLNIFFHEKFILLKYKNCNIGRHVLAATYRETKSHKSFIFFYFFLLKNFYLAGRIIDNAYLRVSDSVAIYVDHVGYLNGLYFRVFALKKKIIYTFCYPRGFFYIDYSKSENTKYNDLEKLIKLRPQSYNKIEYKKENYIKIKSIIENPKLVPWMRLTKFEDKKLPDLKKFNYILYAHSFTDAQLWWGHDGFSSLYQWLDFTLSVLTKKKNFILVKPHPNFYSKIGVEIQKVDKMLYNKIQRKYKKFKNVSFLNHSFENKIILNQIKKDTILISHHGTALLEGATRNFKCISSKATLWDSNFKITNTWSSKNEYFYILNKRWNNLHFSNKKDLLKMEILLIKSSYRYFGKKYIHSNLTIILGYIIEYLYANQ